jgi:stage II sporulation protein AA (anti-sigma F factor antagonist)
MSEEISVVRPQGRLDSSAAPGIEKELLALIAGGSRRLLLDFSGITYVSSMGLRVVLVAAKRMRAEGGRLALCALSPPITEVFEISGFSTILDIHGSSEAAFARLAAG